MAAFSFTRCVILPFYSYQHLVVRSLCFIPEAFRSVQRANGPSVSSSCDNLSKHNDRFHGIKLPQLIPTNKDQQENFKIQLVDPNLWPVSFFSAHTSYGMNGRQEIALNFDMDKCEDEISNEDSIVGISLDFDEIEELKLQKNLFYKLDKGSKEYEENNFRFYQKKSPKKRLEKQMKNKMVKACKISKNSTAKHLPGDSTGVKVMHSVSRPLPGDSTGVKVMHSVSRPLPGDRTGVKVMHSVSKPLVCEVTNEIFSVCKKVRTPTFNQITDSYHLPFCLDIFITKGSVRASVIHRVTSKVVAVAHSISKDMKFDLTHKKDATACAAVGEILAQRAIEDDIHNVVYTPRKGDKIEGKLQIVLQSIIDHGVDVKVKLKQKNFAKGRYPHSFC